MKASFQTRLIFLKKEWVSCLFWLLFPALATLGIIMMSSAIQDDTKVPVGIVLEETTPLTEQLYESIEATPYIRPILLEERDALNKLTTHELDSVFIIRRGYEDSIERSSRNRLIKSYESDLSFAYTPVKETVISYVQQDFTRSRAAYVIQDLNNKWKWEDLIEQSKIIEVEQDLLQTTLSFNEGNESVEQDKLGFVKPWNLWALLTVLATFLVFDWVIKENKNSILPRFAFGKLTFKRYLLNNVIIYTILLLISDGVTMGLFKLFLDETISVSLILSLISYRLMLTLGAFLVGLAFNTIYLFYVTAFSLFLVATLVSGAIIPLDGLTKRWSWMTEVNPLHAFLSGMFFNWWLLLGLVLIVLWYVRREEAND